MLETIMLCVGGTRRAAHLSGVPSYDYPDWSLKQMFATVRLLMTHETVRNIFIPVLVETNGSEKTPGYREKLLQWVLYGVTETERTLRDEGIGVLLLDATRSELLADAARALREKELRDRNVWFQVCTDPEQFWAWMAEAAQHGCSTQGEIRKYILGRDIPPATLLLDFGKPDIFLSKLPPFLIGTVHCYWKQRLGYELLPYEWEQILADVEARQTWQEDKSSRNDSANDYAHLWKSPHIIGLGQRHGPYWRPGGFGPFP